MGINPQIVYVTLFNNQKPVVSDYQPPATLPVSTEIVKVGPNKKYTLVIEFVRQPGPEDQ